MEYITDDELRTLNEARDALKAIAQRAMNDENPAAGGMVFAIAGVAEWGIFRVMNFADSYGHQDIPDNVMHNVKEADDVG